MKTVTFVVKGMHCASCQMLLQENFEETKGVKSAKVSFKDGKAEIEYDESKTDLNALKKVITNEGYSIG